MKFVTLLAIIGVIILSVQAGNLRSYDPLPQLLQMKDKSEFAKNLVSTVELHLSSGGKVEEVIQYVKEARQGTEQDKVNLQTEYNSEMQRYDEEIDKLNLDLNAMAVELQNTILEIQTLIGDIKVLQASEDQLEADLVQLSERESKVRQARDNDIAAFNQRQTRDAKAIKALNEIIPQLNDLLLGGESLVQKTTEELNNYLRVKDVQDPVRSLVQMSMKFNKAKLSTVIEKLENILEAIEVAKDLDEENETTSSARFEALIQEISEIRASKTQELQRVKSQKLAKESDLETARGQKSRLELNIESTTQLRDQTITTQEQARESYERRLQDAAAAIQALSDALAILENNQDSLTSTESDATSRQSQDQ